MDIENKIKTIWSDKNTKNDLTDTIFERGWCYCNDVLEDEKKILLIGFNPSFREDDDQKSNSYSFKDIMNNTRNKSVNTKGCWDPYWNSISNMLCDANVDLRGITSYWDIFSFREKNQSEFKKQIIKENPSSFVIKHIQLAQEIIEEIKPKLIIVKNKEAWAYFGYFFGRDDSNLKKVRWMNYKYEDIGDIPCGETRYELKRIIGIHDGYDLNAIQGGQTSISGAKVLFMPHINQYMKKENRPSAQWLKDIIEKY
jgi:hypothetical protein